MATAETFLALVKSHIEGDDKRFLSVASQLAASEARQGHVTVATELKKLIERARSQNKSFTTPPGPLQLTLNSPIPKGDLAHLLSVSTPDVRLNELVLPKETEDRLSRILLEQQQQERLRQFNLMPRRKILLIGPPGSGKTLTAHALAGELKIPLMTILLEGVITKFMGETATKLRLVFDAMAVQRGVYLFDEFDAIGSKRNSNNDVGEIRRVLNSFLQLLEQDNSHGLIVAATNHPELLDPALFRRFDDVIEYSLPDHSIAEQIFKNRLAPFDTRKVRWGDAAAEAAEMSHADITRAADEAAKLAVLAGHIRIDTKMILMAIQERRIARVR